jgi:hypothetical protein
MKCDWEEIRGFTSPGEYQRFVRYIEGLVSSGYVEEVPVDPAYGPGLIYGGRWFANKNTGQIWRGGQQYRDLQQPCYGIRPTDEHRRHHEQWRPT